MAAAEYADEAVAYIQSEDVKKLFPSINEKIDIPEQEKEQIFFGSWGSYICTDIVASILEALGLKEHIDERDPKLASRSIAMLFSQRTPSHPKKKNIFLG